MWSVDVRHAEKLDAAWAKDDASDGKHPVFFMFTVEGSQALIYQTSVLLTPPNFSTFTYLIDLARQKF